MSTESKKLHLPANKRKNKLTVDKVAAVKSTAPLNEKKEVISKKPTVEQTVENSSPNTDEKLNKFKKQMGRGQPKKNENEKAKNKTLLYWNDAEIEEIEKVAELNGFSKKDKNKYLKSIVRKVIRSELRQFG